MTCSSIRCFLYSNPFTTQNSDCLSSANFHQAFSDSSLFCSSSNFSASALCITCSPSCSASSKNLQLAIGNPLSLMSSSLSSDSNKLSLSHASFSCLILSDVILDSSSLVSSLSLSFSFFPSSSLSSSSLAFTSSRSFCNLCARVITFACTSSRLMIICGMAFNSAMISGCSKNFSLLPIPATHAHTNDTYGVIVNFTCFVLFSSSVSLGVSHILTSTLTNLAGIASPATPCILTSPTCSKFMPSINSSLITGISAPESDSALTFTIDPFSVSFPRISTATCFNCIFFKALLSSFLTVCFTTICSGIISWFGFKFTPHFITFLVSVSSLTSSVDVTCILYYVSLAYFDFPLPCHNLELNADLNHNDGNASRHHLSYNIHYQILLAYSIQSLMYSLMFSTPLVSGLVSHMTFSLENFLVIGSALL